MLRLPHPFCMESIVLGKLCLLEQEIAKHPLWKSSGYGHRCQVLLSKESWGEPVHPKAKTK